MAYRDYSKAREAQARWRARNVEGIKERNRNQVIKTKTKVIEAYGGVCKCCKETELVFLTLDHINDDGAQERRSNKGRGNNFYRWLINNNYPSGYQVLCFNCNWAKSHGGCPHGGLGF